MNRQEIKEKMFALIQNYQNSGQKQLEFCTRHSLKLATFRNWLRKYNVSKREENGFIKLTSGQTSSMIEVIFPNGVRVSLPEGVDPATLRMVIGSW